MLGSYASGVFAELLATDGVREDFERAAVVGVMALHGGLEAGTSELATTVAATTGASRYAVTQPHDLRWHVPSIRYDPAFSPRLRGFVDHVRVAVSIHGYGRRGLERTVLVGGRNRVLAERIAEQISACSSLEVIADLEMIPSGLRGLHPDNPVNLPVHHGVQLELPSGGRSEIDLGALNEAIAGAFADFGEQQRDIG